MVKARIKPGKGVAQEEIEIKKNLVIDTDQEGTTTETGVEQEAMDIPKGGLDPDLGKGGGRGAAGINDLQEKQEIRIAVEEGAGGTPKVMMGVNAKVLVINIERKSKEQSLNLVV